jgi:hypothetical protein
MNPDARSIGSHVATLAWIALRSFLGTLLLLTLAGFVLAGVSFYILSQYYWLYGLLGAALAIIEAVTTGFFLGLKRALALTLAHGLGTLRLGGALVRLIFERMFGLTDGEEHGERGGAMARRLERLPLAQAEKQLNTAVRKLTGDTEQSGWLARKIQTRLLDAVRKYTLARFREQDAQHGGIDLLRTKEELEQTIDVSVVEKVRGGLRFWMVLAILGLPLVVAGQICLIIVLIYGKVI